MSNDNNDHEVNWKMDNKDAHGGFVIVPNEPKPRMIFALVPQSEAAGEMKLRFFASSMFTPEEYNT